MRPPSGLCDTMVSAGELGPQTEWHEEGNAAKGSNPARMAETTEAPLWHENEPAKVESWRLHILLEAGYPVHLAERIAVSEVDLHDAVQLLTRGCDPVTATEVLL